MSSVISFDCLHDVFASHCFNIMSQFVYTNKYDDMDDDIDLKNYAFYHVAIRESS